MLGFIKKMFFVATGFIGLSVVNPLKYVSTRMKQEFQ